MKILILVLSILSFSVSAMTITLTDPDEEVTGDSKVCIYSNAQTTETITVRKSQNCPYAKTFEADE